MPFGAGLAGTAGASAVGAEGCTVQPAASADFVEPTVAICTCPNDSASWTASASRAHQAPNRTLERTQRMIVVLPIRERRDVTIPYRRRNAVTPKQHAQRNRGTWLLHAATRLTESCWPDQASRSLPWTPRKPSHSSARQAAYFPPAPRKTASLERFQWIESQKITQIRH